MVKHLPTVQETWVQSLDWEDPLEKAMAPHSSTLAWKVPWAEERGGLQSLGSQRVGRDERLRFGALAIHGRVHTGTPRHTPLPRHQPCGHENLCSPFADPKNRDLEKMRLT